MTEEKLKEAVNLKGKIDELSSFIFLAERDGFWEKVVFKKEFSLFTNVHGFADRETGYRLSKELSLKLIEVLKDQVEEWKHELDSL